MKYTFTRRRVSTNGRGISVQGFYTNDNPINKGDDFMEKFTKADIYDKYTQLIESKKDAQLERRILKGRRDMLSNNSEVLDIDYDEIKDLNDQISGYDFKIKYLNHQIRNLDYKNISNEDNDEVLERIQDDLACNLKVNDIVIDALIEQYLEYCEEIESANSKKYIRDLKTEKFHVIKQLNDYLSMDEDWLLVKENLKI